MQPLIETAKTMVVAGLTFLGSLYAFALAASATGNHTAANKAWDVLNILVFGFFR